MKRIFYLIVLSLLIGCGGGGGGGSNSQSGSDGTRVISGNVAVPGGGSPSSLTLLSLGETSTVSPQGTFSANVYEDGVAVVSAMPTGSSFALMNVVVSTPISATPASSAARGVRLRAAYQQNAGTAGVSINARTTAVSLVFITPYLLTNDPDNAARILSVIENNSNISILANWIENNFNRSDPWSDPALRQALADSVQSVLTTLASQQVSVPATVRTSAVGFLQLPKKSSLEAMASSLSLASDRYYSDQDYVNVTARENGSQYDLSVESRNMGSIDWIAEMMSINESQFTSLGDFQSKALEKRSVYENERADVRGKLVVPAKSYFRYFDLIQLGFDLAYENVFGSPAKKTVSVPSTTDGIYLIRSYSSAWGHIIDSDEKSFVINTVPNGSIMDTETLVMNGVMAALDTISVFIDIKKLPVPYDDLIKAGVHEAQLRVTTISSPTANDLMIMVAGISKTMAEKALLGIAKDGWANILTGIGSLLGGSIIDLPGKISNGGKAADRVAQMLTSATPMETALVVVGNPFTTAITPGTISVNPVSGSWTSTPQNLAASSSGATAIYYTMVNTTDGSIPADPREPTSSDNDGSISVSGGAGTFQLYATAGQYKRSKLRFRGFNSAGAGPVSGVYSYSINLSATSPLPTLQTNAATATTLNGATLNGIINPNGSATNYWFEYGTSSTLVTYSSTPTKSAGSGTTSQSFGEAISGLQAGTTYYFRMAASCDAGTTRGSIQSFSTEISSVSKWWKIFDWAGWNDVAYDVRQTSDGGYIVIGYATIPGTGERVWLIKTDSNGDILWSKTYTSTYPIANSGKAVQQTSDGGYIIAGSGSASIAMGEDMVLIKTDSIGNILWMKILGGEYYDAANSVQQTSDDGYIIAGSADYYAGQSVYLIKMDSGGNILWSKKYGGAYDDAAYSVQQTSDSGYIIAGYTFSYGAGSADVYLIKTDAVGNMLWSKTFGGTGVDIGRAVRHTSDGGYIIVGDSSSFGTGGTNIYIIKTDSGGNMVWSKTEGGTGGYSYGRSVEQTSDGGYIIGGSTSSFGASGIQDMFLIKMDSSGNTLWYKTYYGGVTGDDVAYAVRQTSDGGYSLAGSTSGDVFLIKTDANGNVQ